MNAQDGFKFFDKGKRYEDISFQLINNLVVIPIEINGKGLNFIFDTGVNKTIVFIVLILVFISLWILDFDLSIFS